MSTGLDEESNELLNIFMSRAYIFTPSVK